VSLDMKLSSFLHVGSIETESASFEDSSICLSRQETSRRHDLVYFPSDDTSTSTLLVNFINFSRQQTSCIMSQASGSTASNDPKAESTRRQPRKKLSGSTRRVPFQQLLNPSQPNATPVDIPGSGPGKENIPPGWFVDSKNEDKHDTSRLMPQTLRRAPQNATSTTRATAKTEKVQKKAVSRVALGETHGNVVRVPKQLVTETPSPDPDVVALRRALRAVIIQRAWRSFIKRRDFNARAIAAANARKEWACEAIGRWWRRVKVGKVPERTTQIEQTEQTGLLDQTNQKKPVEQTKQTQRKPLGKKSAGQRPSIRQSDGRRRTRRL
jgi:hypothetical protein